jgi:hypothetical protein
VLVGNVGSQTIVVPVQVGQLVNREARYTLRIYNSERGSWEEPIHAAGEGINVLAVAIEEYGYRALELTEQQM